MAGRGGRLTSENFASEEKPRKIVCKKTGLQLGIEESAVGLCFSSVSSKCKLVLEGKTVLPHKDECMSYRRRNSGSKGIRN